ncbi:hypothetical protein C7N83_06390 [Neisseria iguanae]|uniref:Uncharacterized protein n=1 Tax=Neisseria iguanae TaxID=90242 RepID=A0A2P7U0B0_9NEIS|nr:hypothetical protein C7N83_06390 [Neisseria iguanae]
MKVNPFIWQNYIESDKGKKAIKLFEKVNPKIFELDLHGYFLDSETINNIRVKLSPCKLYQPVTI